MCNPSAEAAVAVAPLPARTLKPTGEFLRRSCELARSLQSSAAAAAAAAATTKTTTAPLLPLTKTPGDEEDDDHTPPPLAPIKQVCAAAVELRQPAGEREKFSCSRSMTRAARASSAINTAVHWRRRRL